MENDMTDKINPDPLGAGAGLSCLIDGFAIAFSRECRAYVIVPVLVNLILLALGGYAAFRLVNATIFSLVDSLPDYLVFLAYVMSFIAAVMIVFVCCYFFSTIAAIIASPFYGLLADRAELKIHGVQSPDSGFGDIVRDIPRIIRREFQKQLFFLPRALLCLIVSFIPVVNVVSPVPWFMLGSWMGCLQYSDYAYDNHKVAFAAMRNDLRQNFLSTFLLGAVIAVCIAIPVLNIIIPPVAVCAGTKYYVLMNGRSRLPAQPH